MTTTTARPWVCTESGCSYAGQSQRALFTHLHRAHDIRMGERGTADPAVMPDILAMVRRARELIGSIDATARATFLADKAAVLARIEDHQNSAVTRQR